MPARLSQQRVVGCTPEALYDYVTRPSRWHEWHPSSRGAEAGAEPLAEGDTFEEVIELRPLSPLPLRLTRATRYVVEDAVRPERWAARGAARDGWLRIEYRFEPTAGGVRFIRTLTYQTRGPSRLLMPLLAPRMARLSERALDDLKARMEGPGAHG